MFWENFYALCMSINKKPLQVVKEIGLAAGSITSWKKGVIPSKTSFEKLTKYFNVSTEYFFIDHKEIPQDPPVPSKAAEERYAKAKAIFETLSPEKQDAMLALLETLVDNEKK